MAVLQEFKCPSCSGSIEFASDIQKMKCPYCDAEFEVEALKEHDAELKKEAPEEMEWETHAGGEWQDGEADGLRAYVCRSCGGEIMGDTVTAATSCPYCDNPVVITEQISGALRPDYVIPFKIDREAAKQVLRDNCKGKRLLPKTFKDDNHIDEIKGIYVPFWLFDADVDATLRYKGIKTRSWSTSEYIYTEKSFYALHRSGSIGFEKIPVDGSSKMPDDMMESIEPFNFVEAVDFQTAYLSGFFADKYDVDAEQSVERANIRIKKSTEDIFADTINGYTGVTSEACNIQLKNGMTKYALYPVWLLNTTWENKKFVFAINGQTGKFAGDFPVDKKAARWWLLGLTALLGAVTYGIFYIMWLSRLIG